MRPGILPFADIEYSARVFTFSARGVLGTQLSKLSYSKSKHHCESRKKNELFPNNNSPTNWTNAEFGSTLLAADQVTARVKADRTVGVQTNFAHAFVPQRFKIRREGRS